MYAVLNIMDLLDGSFFAESTSGTGSLLLTWRPLVN